jgi:hypothetical protein
LEGPTVRRASPMVLVRVRGKLRSIGGVLDLCGSFSGSNRCPEGPVWFLGLAGRKIVVLSLVLVPVTSCRRSGSILVARWWFLRISRF